MLSLGVNARVTVIPIVARARWLPRGFLSFMLAVAIAGSHGGVEAVAQPAAVSQSEHGQWFYYNDSASEWLKVRAPTSHQSPPVPFPPTYIADSNRLKLKLLPAEKTKLARLMDLLKEINPNPYLHSYVYQFYPRRQPDRVTQADYDARKGFRFGYGINIDMQRMKIANGKVAPGFYLGGGEQGFREPTDWSILSVNVNGIPDSLGGLKGHGYHPYQGPILYLDKEFTYKKRARSSDPLVFRDAAQTNIVSILRRDDSFSTAERLLGPNAGLPPLKIAPENGGFMVLRQLSSTRLFGSGPTNRNDASEDKQRYHTVDTMVVLSHNGRMPLVPLSIGAFLGIVEQRIAEEGLPAEYGNFLQQLRRTYSNRLQDHAIIAAPYVNAWSNKLFLTREGEIRNAMTGRLEAVSPALSARLFVSDPAAGKAFYTYDSTFFENMAPGEIRTLAFVWRERFRMPDHPDYQKRYAPGTGSNGEYVVGDPFGDNPDYYLNHFRRKVDWAKFAALLGK